MERTNLLYNEKENKNNTAETHRLLKGQRVRLRMRHRLGAALPPEGAPAALLADAVHDAYAPPPPVGCSHRRLEAAAA